MAQGAPRGGEYSKKVVHNGYLLKILIIHTTFGSNTFSVQWIYLHPASHQPSGLTFDLLVQKKQNRESCSFNVFWIS